jgi:hypothetical protein
MSFTVKEVGSTAEKSAQEIEQELLDKHKAAEGAAGEIVQTAEEIAAAAQPPAKTEDELKEEDVLSYIEKRYGKQINSIEELTREREEAEPLPEDVAAYFKYKKETGRGIDEFVKLNTDFSKVSPDKLLRDYLVVTEKGLDEEDIDSMMEGYSFNEDLDDEQTIKKIKLDKKKMIAKAKDYFESEKEKYKIPTESVGKLISDEDTKQLKDYKRYIDESVSLSEQNQRREQWYQEKTGEVFGTEFKGFEFDVDGTKLVFTPADANELKKIHSNPSNFTKKFIGEDGLLKDPVGYHKALAVAMNPEKFAKFFYEQGKSEAVDDVMRKTKNVNMTTRNTPQNTSVGGTQIRAVEADSGRGLRIKSKK